MKTLLMGIIMLCISIDSFAQRTLLVLNENNRYTYYQIRNATSVGGDTLQERGILFFKEKYPKVNISKAADGVKGKGSVQLFRAGLIASQEEGAINYTIQIDFKDGRYRLLMGDFVYVPYQRTRYGTFLPAPGLGVPLEKQEKFNKSKLAAYLDKIGGYCAGLDAELNKYLNHNTAAKTDDLTKGMKKVSTTNW